MWGVTCQCRQEPLLVTEGVLKRWWFFSHPASGLQLSWLTCKTSRMRKGSLVMIQLNEYFSSYSALSLGRRWCLFPVQRYLLIYHLRSKQRSREELFSFEQHLLLYWEQAAFHFTAYTEGINVPLSGSKYNDDAKLWALPVLRLCSMGWKAAWSMGPACIVHTGLGELNFATCWYF